MKKQLKYTTLKEIWGYNSFRPLQEEIIDHVMDGKDALVIMPTGGGKSLCFQLPAVIMEGMAVVISPLIALINDQVTALREVGVAAAALHSNLSEHELDQTRSDVLDGKVKLLYISPERANSPGFSDFLNQVKISLFAIDEAHCVSVWGIDFRPDYVLLNEIRDKFSDVPFIGCTATADTATQKDICDQLHLTTPEIFVSSYERSNITIETRPSDKRFMQVVEFLKDVKGQSGIIYCLSRKETERLSSKLSERGYNCGYYHAGMSAEERARTQCEFQNDKIQFICATIAFGMGIDKSNINWIIHYSMPKNIEGYYQEIGRAGRDGTPVKALLFYSWGDYIMLKKFIDDSPAEETYKIVQYAKLDRMWEFASATECRTNLILNYFGEFRLKSCNHCDNCNNPPESKEGTVIAQKALSAIVRCDEKVGLNMLIDVLRGSYRSSVLSMGYDKIKTFGAGRDISFFDWKVYLVQLINQGFIRVDYTDGFNLKTTPLSKEVLFNGRSVRLVELNLNRKSEKEDTIDESSTSDSKREWGGTSNDLIEKLKQWRKEVANTKKVPAYVIFANKALIDIAAKKPTTIGELLDVEGIGKVRCEQYGRDILDIIAGKYENSQPKPKNEKKDTVSTYQVTKGLYDEGLTIEEIAEARGISKETIIKHLVHLYNSSENIDLNKFVPDENIEKIKVAWEKAGRPMSLASIAEYMIDPVDYNQMRMALALITKEQE